VGSCLTFTGATRLFLLYGNSNGSFAPVAASMMTEAGLAMILGSMIKFYRVTGRTDSTASVVAG
jgi:hypothetical protein